MTRGNAGARWLVKSERIVASLLFRCRSRVGTYSLECIENTPSSSGGIRAAIWKNDTEAGVRYNVTIERIYKDKDEWKSTGSFGRDDLLLLAKAVDQAHTWIFAQPKPEKPEAK